MLSPIGSVLNEDDTPSVTERANLSSIRNSLENGNEAKIREAPIYRKLEQNTKNSIRAKTAPRRAHGKNHFNNIDTDQVTMYSANNANYISNIKNDMNMTSGEIFQNGNERASQLLWSALCENNPLGRYTKGKSRAEFYKDIMYNKALKEIRGQNEIDVEKLLERKCMINIVRANKIYRKMQSNDDDCNLPKAKLLTKTTFLLNPEEYENECDMSLPKPSTTANNGNQDKEVGQNVFTFFSPDGAVNEHIADEPLHKKNTTDCSMSLNPQTNKNSNQHKPPRHSTQSPKPSRRVVNKSKFSNSKSPNNAQNKHELKPRSAKNNSIIRESDVVNELEKAAVKRLEDQIRAVEILQKLKAKAQRRNSHDMNILDVLRSNKSSNNDDNHRHHPHHHLQQHEILPSLNNIKKRESILGIEDGKTHDKTYKDRLSSFVTGVKEKLRKKMEKKAKEDRINNLLNKDIKEDFNRLAQKFDQYKVKLI